MATNPDQAVISTLIPSSNEPDRLAKRKSLTPQQQLSATKLPRVDANSKIMHPTTKDRELARGAEAVVTLSHFFGRTAVRKKRLPKGYRHPELDAKLTLHRIQQEARTMLRLRKAGIRVPAVYSVDLKSGLLVMEFVDGITLKEFLQLGQHTSADVMLKAGRAVAQMHNADIVHGDLTTGNIMVKGEQVCIIDFGLSSANGTDEDVAVDLYVLERAVISAHSEKAQQLNQLFLQAYKEELKRPAVLKRLEQVRSRGRKRDMTG